MNVCFFVMKMAATAVIRASISDVRLLPVRHKCITGTERSYMSPVPIKLSDITYYVKVKQSRYRPGVTQRVPGS
jgi:hypothetical protein